MKFLLKKERVFSFRGSALQVFGQLAGLQYGLGFAKTIFWGGKGFRKTSANFLVVVSARPQEGFGEECGRVLVQKETGDKPLTDNISYATIGTENSTERSLKMEKIRTAVLDEPGLYLLGILVSAILLAFGFSMEQAVTVLFWWFVSCAVPVGLYMAFCSVMAIFLEKEIADETYPGWNLEHRPSLQDLKKTDPEQARWMGEMYDMLDQTSSHLGVIHLVLTISIFVSLVVGVFFLQSFVVNTGWWRLILAIVLIGYGLVMHSNKTKEVWFEKMSYSRIRTEGKREN